MLEQIAVTDFIDVIDKIGKLEEVVNSINTTLDECESLLRKPVLSFDIHDNLKAYVGDAYKVIVSCTDGVDVWFISGGEYMLIGSVLEPVGGVSRTLLPTIDLSNLTVRDIVMLAMYEKHTGFVTNLVEAVTKKDRELGKRLEVLKTVVDAVMPLVEKLQQ